MLTAYISARTVRKASWALWALSRACLANSIMPARYWCKSSSSSTVSKLARKRTSSVTVKPLYAAETPAWIAPTYLEAWRAISFTIISCWLLGGSLGIGYIQPSYSWNTEPHERWRLDNRPRLQESKWLSGYFSKASEIAVLGIVKWKRRWSHNKADEGRVESGSFVQQRFSVIGSILIVSEYKYSRKRGLIGRPTRFSSMNSVARQFLAFINEASAMHLNRFESRSIRSHSLCAFQKRRPISWIKQPGAKSWNVPVWSLKLHVTLKEKETRTCTKSLYASCKLSVLS